MNEPKRAHVLPRKALLALCTGVLALLFSALPALTLWLQDARLLAQPQARTHRADALALTGDDLYLTRILKKYSQRTGIQGYQAASTNPYSMSQMTSTTLLDHLNALCAAGVLPEEWRAYCAEHVGNIVFTSVDSLGFVHYIGYNGLGHMPDYGCYVVGITVESISQKVVAVWISAAQAGRLSAPPVQPTLEAYRTYLELDAMDDWEAPTDTLWADTALYSPRAELLLHCENGSYDANTYRHYEMFDGEWTSALFPRTYFCLNAVSLPEETVRGWQAYARSFANPADAWLPSGAPEESIAEIAGEEALG